LCLDPRVKPEDDDLLGMEEGILLMRCAMEEVEVEVDVEVEVEVEENISRSSTLRHPRA